MGMDDFTEKLADALSKEFGTFLAAPREQWMVAATGIVEKMGLEELRINVGNTKGDELRRFRAFVFKGEEF